MREAIIEDTNTAAPKLPLGIKATVTTQPMIRACRMQAEATLERPADKRLQKKLERLANTGGSTDQSQYKGTDLIDFGGDDTDNAAFKKHERRWQRDFSSLLGTKAALNGRGKL
jgi:hypothetical protein